MFIVSSFKVTKIYCTFWENQEKSGVGKKWKLNACNKRITKLISSMQRKSVKCKLLWNFYVQWRKKKDRKISMSMQKLKHLARGEVQDYIKSAWGKYLNCRKMSWKKKKKLALFELSSIIILEFCTILFHINIADSIENDLFEFDVASSNISPPPALIGTGSFLC